MTIEKILEQKKKKGVVYSIRPESHISEAAKILVEKRIGALMVLDDQQRIKGIVSERDILRKIAKGDFHDVFVKDVMTPKEQLIMSNSENDIRYVISIMAENNIRHIPIVEAQKLVALISMRDLAKALLTEYEKRIADDIFETDAG